MIGWIKRRIWRKKIEAQSKIVITIPVLSPKSTSSTHGLRELRELLESADFKKIIEVLATKLREVGLNDRDVQKIIQSLDEEKIRVVIKRVGLLRSLERREAEKRTFTSSSPISR
jgi:G:T/U-mismatch repair DNA glycosylase